MKLRNILTLGALGALVTLGLASCGKKSNTNYEHGELKVSQVTGVIRNAGDIIAEKKGFFKEEGVKVTPVNLGGTNALTAINNNSDELDILTTGFVPDVQAIVNGYDNLRFVGGTAVEGGAIIAKKGRASQYKNSTTIIDYNAVKSASIAFAVGEASWVVTNEYLIENDSTYTQTVRNNLNITNVADAQTTALQIGQGNFELGFLPLEYAYLYEEAYGIEIVAEAGQLIPEYVCCRQVTSAQKIEEKSDAFVAYERARIKAWEYIEDDSNKDKVVQIISDYIHKEEDYVENYIYGGITKWSVDPNKKGIATYTSALRNAGIVTDENLDITSYVDTSLYEEAITTLASENPTDAFIHGKLQLFNDYNK